MYFQIIKERLQEKLKFVSKKQFLSIILIIISIIGGIIYYAIKSMEFLKNDDIIINSMEINEIADNEEKVADLNIVEIEKIKVYITGEVRNPGVIEISVGERIEDAIEKAGGITEDADLKNVNLAYKLEDGQKVYIPNVNDKDEIEIVSIENGDNIIENSSSKFSNRRININTASIENLCEIPGIGQSLAQRIINYREENGKFKSIDDLKNVSGIGEKKFDGIKEYIIVK